MKNLFTLLLGLASISLYAQEYQNASLPKDAPVAIKVTDFKNNDLPGEIIVFKSLQNSREYQGISDPQGNIAIRLPAGDKYEIFILGFKDSTSYNVLDIPAPPPNAFYKDPFKVAIQFMPAKTFVLENCNFETGKAILEPASYAVLDELVAFLNRKEDVRIEIGGHTDNVGSKTSNLKLSEDRANMVMTYLIGKGISPSRLEAKGYGMSEPIAENTSEEGRAQNRRTEVKILE